MSADSFCARHFSVRILTAAGLDSSLSTLNETSYATELLGGGADLRVDTKNF